MTIFVLSKTDKPLMPTSNIKKIRKLLKNNRAKIVKHEPLTVQLQYETTSYTQPIELTEDTGYQHIGLSVKSEKHEFFSAEYTLLPNEKEKHENQNRMYRRARRSRLRYRKPRFKNRNKPEKWIAPSLKNKADRHVDLYLKFKNICPITSVTLENGQFDTTALDAIQQGKPIPKNIGYQFGPRYGYDTLREAVFSRDNHRCLVCGKTNTVLRLHHVGFRNKDRSNRMSNLATVCEACHTPKNHKPNGKLWNLKPPKGTASAAFMNVVRWYIYNEITKSGDIPVHITYGAVTKRTRIDRNIEKSHANDAYCIGAFIPKHRTPTNYYQKRRRNNRILEKFFDAQYIDIRDHTKKKAAELSCNRTNRSIPRNNPNNERKYRGQKITKGKRYIRTKRHPVQAGDLITTKGYKVICKGTISYGSRVVLFRANNSPTGKAITVKTEQVKIIKHADGWISVSDPCYFI